MNTNSENVGYRNFGGAHCRHVRYSALHNLRGSSTDWISCRQTRKLHQG